MTAKEAYKKYEHLDELLSDGEWLPEGIVGKIMFDLWCAVKFDADMDDAWALRQKNSKTDVSKGC